jgi:hypothetical protein
VRVLSRRRALASVAEKVEVPNGATPPRPAAIARSPLPAAKAIPIAELTWRERARVAGRVRSMRIQPWGGVPTLECVLVDATGGVAVVFLGRREVAGIHPGTCLTVEGMVGDHNGRLAILNPLYDFVTS